jgi:hypothetical protein
MREGLLAYLTGKIRALGAPIAEGRPKAMHCELNSQQKAGILIKRCLGQARSIPTRENEIGNRGIGNPSYQPDSQR